MTIVKSIPPVEAQAFRGSAIRRSRFIAGIVILITTGWIAFIWSYRFLPMHDYPMWIYVGHVFSQLIRHQAPSGFSIVPWPVPDTLFVGTTGLLDLFLPPEVSGKIWLTLVVGMFALGSYRLVGSLSARRDSPWLLLPLLFVFHRNFWIGEVAFAFSLGVLFFCLSLVLSPKNSWRGRDLWLIAGLSILLFYSHAIAYLCWLIVLALLVLLESRRTPRIKVLLAVFPSLLLTAIYLLTRRPRPVAGAVASWFDFDAKAKLGRALSVLSPIHFFDPFYGSDPRSLKVLAIAFNLATILLGLLLVALWFRNLLRRPFWALELKYGARAMAIAPLVCFLAFLFAPFLAAFGAHDMNERFILPAFIFMLASLSSSTGYALPERAEWSLTLLAAAAVSFVLGFHCFYVGSVAHKLQGAYDAALQAHLNADFRDLGENQFETFRLTPSDSEGSRLLPVHDAFGFFADYLRLAEPASAPIIQTSIVATSAQYHPLLDKYNQLTQFPSAIVIFGTQSHNHAVAALMADRYRMTVDAEYVSVLQPKADVSH